MAAEIVNLRRIRKDKARLDAGRQAEERRIRHGRTKEEVRKIRKEAARALADLDGKRLIDSDPKPGS